MATTDDFGDELPTDDKTVGQTGHVEDHNRLSRELAEVQDVVKQIVANTPTIKGSYSSINSLPATGAYGDMYLVGSEANLYSWFTKAPDTTPDWHSVGNLRGEQGPAGAAGTIVGILDFGEVPPVGTAAGSLWWVADETTTVPGPDLTPIVVGTVANCSDATSTTLSLTGGGIVTQAGDIAVMCVVHGSSDAIVCPSGWNDPGLTTAAYYQSVGTTVHARIFTRECTASMGNITVNAKTGTKIAASVMIFRNVTLGANGEVNAINSVSTDTDSLTRAAPTVSPTASSIVCGFWFERVGSGNTAGATVAKPAAFTAGSTAGVTQNTGSGVTSCMGGYDLTANATAGRPSGTQNWVKTGTTSTQLGAFTLALAVA